MITILLKQFFYSDCDRRACQNRVLGIKKEIKLLTSPWLVFNSTRISNNSNYNNNNDYNEEKKKRSLLLQERGMRRMRSFSLVIDRSATTRKTRSYFGVLRYTSKVLFGKWQSKH